MFKNYIKNEVQKEVRKQIQELDIQSTIERTIEEAMRILSMNSGYRGSSFLSTRVASDFHSLLRRNNVDTFKRYISAISSQHSVLEELKSELKNQINEEVKKENFIDEIVRKINNKQLKS